MTQRQTPSSFAAASTSAQHQPQGKPAVVMFMGPPASGKGTQAQLLLDQGGFERVETGSLLRRMRDDHSPLAREVRALIDAGKLAPPPLVAELVLKEARRVLSTGTGVIFDGSPRTLFEAEMLLEALKRDGIHRLLVVALELSKLEAIERILQRWICSSCGHQIALPSGQSSACPACGGTLTRRPDDTPDVLDRRWEEFTFRTLPVIHYFERQGLVAHINGHQPVPDVAADVRQVVEQRFRS